MLRPAKVIEILTQYQIEGPHFDFLCQYQQTMDFIGFGPVQQTETSLPITVSEILQNFFYQQDGLTRFLPSPSIQDRLSGFIIEVKSRSTKNHWNPFNYSFSANQEEMFLKATKFRFKVILCGVTLADDWEISVVFTNRDGKILPQDFFNLDQ
ncbi:MAG: hypothetical protein ACW97Z_07660 [Candidatus Hodarchaeales archaeon]